VASVRGFWPVAWERDALLDGVDGFLAAARTGSTRDWAQLVLVPAPEVPPGSGTVPIVATLSLYKPRRVWRELLTWG